MGKKLEIKIRAKKSVLHLTIFLCTYNLMSVFIFRESLFRQLCALNWILESMNLNPSAEDLKNLAPVMSSWRLK